MRTFIETYLADPSKAVDEARQRLDTEAWIDDFDEDMRRLHLLNSICMRR